MKKIILLLILPFLLLAEKVDDNRSIFIDPKDGYLDLSEFLASKKGFLPIPMIMTGPTFGLGGGLNVMFLHDSLMSKKNENGHYIPPSISGVMGGATENGTKFGAAYHMGFYMDGNLRTTTFIGRPDANMDYGSHDISLNTLGYFAYQELKYRFLETNLFYGVNYTYMEIDTSVNNVPNNIPPEVEEFIKPYLGSKVYSGLAVVIEYDSRDSIFTPDKGLYAKVLADFYTSTLGSEKDFINYRAKAFYYYPFSSKFVMGLRGEIQSIQGSDRAPSFMTPSIMLRGISNHQYQGQTAAISELELRYEVFHRHWLVGFTGVGKVFGDYTSEIDRDNLSGKQSFSQADFHASYGIGYRYELARRFKLLAGFDIAKSETDTAFYLTVGSAWNAFY